MGLSVRTKYGTPLKHFDAVIAQFDVYKRNADGDWKPAKVRVWVDEADPTRLRVDGDGDICIMPGGSQSRVSIGFPNSDTP